MDVCGKSDMHVPIKPGDIVVAVGVQISTRGERAKLYPYTSDWAIATRCDDGSLGLVLCRKPPTGAGREWMLVLTDDRLGYMCEGDGWATVNTEG